MGGCTSAPKKQAVSGLQSKQPPAAGTSASDDGRPSTARAPSTANSDLHSPSSDPLRQSAVDRARSGSEMLSLIVPNAERGDLLKSVPLLRALTENQRDKLGGIMKERSFDANQTIFRQGDEPDGFYIILEGRVRLTNSAGAGAAETKEQKDVAFAMLRNGDYFGEMALVNDDKRSADVVAETALQTLFLHRKYFNMMFGGDVLEVHFARRVGVTSATKDDLKAQEVNEEDRKKSEATVAMLISAMDENPLLKAISVEQKRAVVDQMYRMTVAAGTSVIKQGDAGTNLFVLESGTLEVSKREGDAPAKVLKTLEQGRVFGELAILYNAPRAATITATTAATLWAVDRFTFRRVSKNVGENAIKRVARFLQEVPLLQPLTEFEREKIAEALEEVGLNTGDVVCNEGEEGDCMYFLVAGVCVATRKSAQTEGGIVKEYKEPGAYFGELALKSGNEGRRQATVTCTQPNTWLLKLGRDAFKLLMGPLEELMTKHESKYSDQGAVAQESKSAQRVIAWENLKTVGLLGKGSYGCVQFVEDVTTGEAFALKSVWKQQIVETQQEEHIMSEKNVMQQLLHPFITTLHGTFRSQDRLHFLLEPCLGGELFTLLRKRRLFPEETAMFYAASVVLAFSYMHSKDTVYRDLKPENLMITSSGYLKVADFGFAKKVVGKTWTLCGTPDYLAPEIVSSKGHGKGVDWWTLGVLIFEMLASYPPFYDEDQMRTYNKILETNIRFPSTISEPARAIILAFLDKRPTRRLGVGKGGVDRIQQSQWFAKFDWEGLMNMTLDAPIEVKSKTREDMKKVEAQGPMQYVDNGSNWDAAFGPLIVDSSNSKLIL